MTFDERILQWQPFFTTVAAAAATLVGLLFVSLSINRDKISLDTNKALSRLARRTFADFSFILLIALLFLIPYEGRRALTYELLALAALRLKALIREVITVFRESDYRENGKSPAAEMIREFFLPVLTIAGLVAAGIGVWHEDILAVYYYVVPVIATLLLRGSRHAWQLLIIESE